MKFKNILVTGGSGFIGFNFIEFLFEQALPIKIINVDLLTYASRKESSAWNHFYKADIRDKYSLYKIFQEHKPDLVINFAAESHVDRSINDATPFVTTNVLGTQCLLDLSLECGVQRFVQVSTDEVYGSLRLLGKPFVEYNKLKPNSPYSASKAAADMLVRSYHVTHGMDTVITRCSNNYGPFQHEEKFIPKIITSILKGKKVPVYGTGENRRDWIYVKDHCDGIWSAALLGKSGDIYNFGGNSEYSNIEIVRLITGIIEPESSPNKYVEFVKDRKGHDFRYAIDFSKASKKLAWKPKVLFEEGIQKTVEWYKSN